MSLRETFFYARELADAFLEAAADVVAMTAAKVSLLIIFSSFSIVNHETKNFFLYACDCKT